MMRSAQAPGSAGSERPACALASSELVIGPVGWKSASTCVSVLVRPASARASSVLVGIGFARATPAVAIESASATANERLSFDEIVNLLVLCVCFMGSSLRIGTPSLPPDPTGDGLASTSAGNPWSETLLSAPSLEEEVHVRILDVGERALLRGLLGEDDRMLRSGV